MIITAAPPRLGHADISAALEILSEAFPRAFALYERRRRPLKIGIHADIAARCPALTPREIGRALQLYTGSRGYLQAVAFGSARVDLDGNPAGSITAEHRERARLRLLERAERRARRQVALQAQSERSGDGVAALKIAAQRRKANGGAR